MMQLTWIQIKYHQIVKLGYMYVILIQNFIRHVVRKWLSAGEGANRFIPGCELISTEKYSIIII